jgi:hypothetical protein
VRLTGKLQCCISTKRGRKTNNQKHGDTYTHGLPSVVWGLEHQKKMEEAVFNMNLLEREAQSCNTKEEFAGVES